MTGWESWSYLATLLAGLGCMALMDRRWRLAFWADAPRATVVVLAGMAVFVAWDLAALHLDLYRPGEGTAMTGIQVAAGLPLEELFFIGFLSYLTLVLHRLVDTRLATRLVRRRPEGAGAEGTGAGGRRAVERRAAGDQPAGRRREHR